MTICQPSLQLLAYGLDPLSQNFQRQSPASLTISAGISRSGALPSDGPLAQSHRHGRPAGTVGVQNLQQEGPDGQDGTPEAIPPDVPAVSADSLDIIGRPMLRQLVAST
jgi:hypothetical protein